MNALDVLLLIYKSAILQISKIEGELHIKHKDKENPTTGTPKWWYVVHGSESMHSYGT